MKKVALFFLCVTIAFPCFAAADDLYYLWDIPFPHSARKYADALDQQKGIKLDIDYRKRNTDWHETAVFGPSPDITLFGHPFAISYEHSYGGPYKVTFLERTQITFEKYSARTYDPNSVPFQNGIQISQTVLQSFVSKYGEPDYIQLHYQSNFRAWSNGEAAYSSEKSHLPTSDIFELSENTTKKIVELFDSFDYTTEGRHFKLVICYQNVRLSIILHISDDGSTFTYENSIVYNWFVYPMEEETSTYKEQKATYVDTGL